MADVFARLLETPELPWGVFTVEPGGTIASEVSESARRLLGDLVAPGACWSEDGETLIDRDDRQVQVRPIGGGLWVVEDRSAEVAALQRAEISELRVGLLRQWDAFSGFVEETLPGIEAAKGASPDEKRAFVREVETAARAFGLTAVAEGASAVGGRPDIEPDDLDELAAVLWSFIDEHAEALAFDPSRLEMSGDAGGTSEPGAVHLRPVRQLLGPVEAVATRVAEQHGRLVELRVEGEEVAVDAELMEPVLRALGPLLENAVIHGIEPPEERGEKPQVGEIVLRFGETSNAWSVAVEDDGRGFDLDALVVRARERKLLSAEGLEGLGPRGRLGLAFLAGVSSGEGETAGLAEVKDAVEDVGASLKVVTHAGRGTTIATTVPKRAFAAKASTHDIFVRLMRSTTPPMG